MHPAGYAHNPSGPLCGCRSLLFSSDNDRVGKVVVIPKGSFGVHVQALPLCQKPLARSLTVGDAVNQVVFGAVEVDYLFSDSKYLYSRESVFIYPVRE